MFLEENKNRHEMTRIDGVPRAPDTSLRGGFEVTVWRNLHCMPVRRAASQFKAHSGETG